MIYVMQFSGFVKVGKSQNLPLRIRSLSSKYGEDPLNVWSSSELELSSEAEVIAHKNLESSHIEGERFNCSFEDAVSACMNACARSESMVCAGEIEGLKIMVDPATGYINATEFKKQSAITLSIAQFVKSEGVKHVNEHIERISGQRSYFTCLGRDARTFVHPYVFIEMLRSMGARKKVLVYQWMLYEMPGCAPIADCISKTMDAVNFYA